MSGNKQKNQGFTLIEMLVVLGIFSILMVVIVNVFLLALNSQRQSSLRQQTLANLRYVAETIVRKIRTSEIDYSYVYDGDGETGIAGFEQELSLIDQDGNNYIFYLSGGEVKLLANGQESAMTDVNEVKIVSLRFYIDPVTNPFAEERCNDSLKPAANGCLNNTISCTVNDNSGLTGFCICNPDADVLSSCGTQSCDDAALGGADDNLGLCLPFDVQPRVTMVLGFESVGGKPEDQKRIFLQTTTSSRVYKR
ncbi:MAG: type II secretion system protein [Candidatus Buchananbacteria bacterium]|nr:type II secretion system protein [Candidatus Buchananbacteria bacterium]